MVLIRHYKYTYLTNLISVILSLVTCMHPSTMSVRFYLTTGKCNSLTHQYTTRHRKRAVKSRRRYDVPCRGMAFIHPLVPLEQLVMQQGQLFEHYSPVKLPSS